MGIIFGQRILSRKDCDGDNYVTCIFGPLVLLISCFPPEVSGTWDQSAFHQTLESLFKVYYLFVCFGGEVNFAHGEIERLFVENV